MRWLRIGLLGAIAVALVACGGGADQQATSPQSESFEAQFDVVLENGTKIFDPAEVTVTGDHGTVTVNNTLDAEHGFMIRELGIEEVVPANESISVTVEDAEPGEYTVDCQLHAAHKESTLIVEAP